MADGAKHDFYLAELKTALQDYHRVNRDVLKLADDRRQKGRLVKSLLAILKLQVGEGEAQTLLEKAQLDQLARPFLTLKTLKTAGTATVVRRRRGEKQAVDPATVLAKGTPVKMMSGNYQGYKGVIASTQARQGRKGLDVTYFLALEGPKGDRKRTSVKHGTLRKSWNVVE
jgi:hypothetical protein